MPFTRVCLFLILSLFSTRLTAHEVWIEPENWQVPVGTQVAAQLLNGENFKGLELSWNPRSIIRAEMWAGETGVSLTGRPGDIPALATPAALDGLMTLVYHSRPSTLVYKDYEKFADFLREKGHGDILSQHDTRGLSRTAIKEAFSRYVKNLVAVGSGRGSDERRGLEIEIVALSNPYTMVPGSAMQVQVFYQDAPLAKTRVTIFEKAQDGVVRTSHHQTDAQGEIAFGTTPGAIYLVDTVVVREPTRALVVQTRGAVWESLWASLTFRVPDAQ